MVTLLPVLPSLSDNIRGALLRETITRFSQLALVTVPLVALSGTIIYLAEQPSVESTLNTGYGREVLIKVGLLFVLMIPASYNLRKVGPGLVKLRNKAGSALQALAGGFRRSIRWEALLVSVVVCLLGPSHPLGPRHRPLCLRGQCAHPRARLANRWHAPLDAHQSIGQGNRNLRPSLHPYLDADGARRGRDPHHNPQRCRR